ncbi:MAG TPA: sigma-70 family RNA polymerase sigma factor [Aggregatilinea sp.]|uniref:sigma-70 family RNA polymerase sigma factor n=1 Tax=Aggregatilinea sp. TaxID=2806333 RepID=UPI002C88845A|nr:sigma-70 family RNA polymerase sigma factor [Aggregatilinea sp.]HML22608.1 sigma-70 family RNA polymerase sigma factor [Aggregatilinea sp.]
MRCLFCLCNDKAAWTQSAIPQEATEPKVIQELMNRADQRGYVTFEDVLELLDEDSDDVNAIEAVLDELDELGIELRQDTSDDDDLDQREREFEAEEESHDPGVGDINAVSADDPVGLYFRQMAQEPLLTANEEIELAKRIELGREALLQLEGMSPNDDEYDHLQQLVSDGQAAREHLGRANTRLVVSIAKRYMGQGLPFPDLIQEGNVGLMRAVDKYDYKRGNRFSTYATWWIRQAITRALAQKTRTIRIPLHMTERIRQMYRTAQVLEQTLGHRPTPEEIAKEMELPPESVRGMMDASQHAIALERPVGDDGDSEFGDFIEDQDSPSPVEAATQHLLQETIEEVLSELTPRQSHILRLRFGLGGGEPHTLEEIANKFGLSRERIRQLEKEALRRLRHPRLAHNLRDYLS